MMINFRDWAREHAEMTDDPRGDFISDLVNDSLWDADPQTVFREYAAWRDHK